MNKIILYFLLVNINFIGGLFCFAQDKYKISKIQQEDKVIPVIVLGGGVAGMTAALCLVQEGVSCLLIGGPKPGGSLTQSQLVRNWPGKMGERGLKIMAEMWQHAYKMRIPILEKEKVIAVDFSTWPYRIKTRNFDNEKESEYAALSCIIATGAEINHLNIPGELEKDGYWGRGVSFCVWCDGPLYYDKKVVIIGGGRSALFKANFMANIAKEVFVIVRKNKFSVENVPEIEQLYEKKNVTVLFDTQAREFKGDGDSLTHVVLENSKTNLRWEEEIDGVFLSIGWKPNTNFFDGQFELNAQGAIVLKHDQSTSIEGVFAAGEVCQLHYLQAIVAAGQGCVAALQSKDFLQKIGLFEKKLKSWWEIDFSESPIKEIQSIEDFDLFVVQEVCPVIVNFYSPWCSLCKNMLPILEECAELFDGKIKFVKINIGGGNIVPNELIRRIHGKDIKGVPCILFVEKGQEIERFLGACSCDEFTIKLKQIFNTLDFS